MLFQDITLINYARPLMERAKARKSVGPYHWRPTAPGHGRGFYQDSKSLSCDRHGSSFDLRLEDANEFLQGSRLQFIDGYYISGLEDDTLKPIVARLPRGRGFLAGWTMGAGMCGSLDGTIHETIEDAARAAHAEAERDAEKEREYQEAHADDEDDE